MPEPTIRNNPCIEVADDALWCDDCDEIIDEGEEFFAGNLKNQCLNCGQKKERV